MITILSTQEDYSTSNVIDWLHYLNSNYVRINNNDSIDVEVALNNKVEKIKISNKKWTLKRFNCYWYRRGNLNINNSFIDVNKGNLTAELNEFVFYESKYLKEYIHYYFKNNSACINNYSDIFINKLQVLSIAKKCKLDIPDTVVTNSKQILQSFVKKHKSIITKPIRESFSINYKENNYYFHTIELNNKNIYSFPKKFNHLLAQKFINKKFELRIFFLNNKFYSSAIFSSADPKTKIDVRNYNIDNPNRIVPYSLPKTIELKLIKLCKLLEINSCSIDMIVNNKNKYIFLEVNPIGQYSQVSNPCNYYLDEKIALSLINNDK